MMWLVRLSRRKIHIHAWQKILSKLTCDEINFAENVSSTDDATNRVGVGTGVNSNIDDIWSENVSTIA